MPDDRGSCSICGDEGLVAEVVEAAGCGSEGRVRLEAGEDAGRELRVALDLVPTAEEGDRVLVHMGFAIGLVREQTADGRPRHDAGSSTREAEG